MAMQEGWEEAPDGVGHRALRPSVVESEQKETADWDICRIYSILTFNTITFQELLQAQLPDASTIVPLWG